MSEIQMNQEIESFIEENKITLTSIVTRENAQRQKVGMDILTNEEIHNAVIIMIEMKKNGQPIEEYTFSGPRNQNRRTPQPSQSMQTEQNTTQQNQSSKMFFTVEQCNNGYILTANGNAYIFKNEEELMQVFKSIFSITHTKETDTHTPPTKTGAQCKLQQHKPKISKHLITNSLKPLSKPEKLEDGTMQP